MLPMTDMHLHAVLASAVQYIVMVGIVMAHAVMPKEERCASTHHYAHETARLWGANYEVNGFCATWYRSVADFCIPLPALSACDQGHGLNLDPPSQSSC